MTKTTEGRAASCPLCKAEIPLGREASASDEARITAHLLTHSLAEWVVCVQDLRQQVAQIDGLRAMPRCAMARA